MKNFLLLSFSFLLILGCQKEDLPIVTDRPSVRIDEPVTALLGGQVMGEHSQPLADAKITVGTRTVLTDENGFFLFPELAMNQAGTAVQVRKEGYFNFVTWVYPTMDSRNFVTVNLLAKEIVGDFSATDGANLSLGEARVELPPSAYVTAAGQAYLGRVEVAARWLDAADPVNLSSLPGSSLGLTQEGDYRAVLQTGMLALELLTPAGEELALAENSTAKLRLPVAQQWRGGVTPERPLWYLDEEHGTWLQDGTATWQGDYYEAEVSHFTFWCCSPPYPFVNLRGRLVTAANEPIGQRAVGMEVVNTGLLQGGVRTNSLGQFSGFAPAEEVLRMVVWNTCGEEAYSEQIGSHTLTTDLGTFVLTNEYYFKFRGQALDCDFAPLPNAFVTVRWNGYNRTYLADEEGNYAFGWYLCAESGSPAPLELRLADINTGFVSPWLERELMPEVDFSHQLACTTPEEDFIEILCAGETRVFLTPDAWGDYGSGQLMIWDSLNVLGQGGAPTEISILGQGDLYPAAGGMINGIEVEYKFATVNGELLQISCFTNSTVPCDGFSLLVTENEGPGGYVGGIFNGVLWSGNTEVPLNGRFRIRQQ